MKRIVILGAGKAEQDQQYLHERRDLMYSCPISGQVKPEYREILEKNKIRWEEGKHSEDLIFTAEEIIKSPGIHDDAPTDYKAQGERHTGIIGN